LRCPIARWPRTSTDAETRQGSCGGVFASVWEQLTTELEEVLYADDERIVARACFRGRGAGSGVEVDRLVFYSLRMRDGLLAYVGAFDDEASARRDLGLDDDD
jgi:hypothetical protein